MKQRLVVGPAVGGAAPQRAQVAAVAVEAVARGDGRRMRILAQFLGEAGVEVANRRNVETVEPDHRLAGGVAMVVPLPAGGQHQIERPHHRLFAVDGGEGAFTLEHKAQGALAVTVTRRDLAGQDQLQSGIEAGRDRRLARHARVFEDQDAALGLRGADQIARPHQIVARHTIGPAMDLRRRGRFGGHQRREHFPQRRQAGGRHFVIQRAKLGRLVVGQGGGVGHRSIISLPER